MRNRFIADLVGMAEKDERIWLLTGDLGFNVVEVFEKSFPDRYLNTGIAEQHMMGVAAGLALNGKVPFVYSIANFNTFRCLEQIRNDVAYHDLPVRIISVGGGMGYGNAGYSHHAIEDLSVMRAIPGMQVFAPCDPLELSEILAEIQNLTKPVYIRVGKGSEPVLTEGCDRFEIGAPRKMRDGRGICFVTTGTIAGQALKAAGILAEQGVVDARVIGCPTVSSLDIEVFERHLADIDEVFLIEEHGESSAFQVLFEQGYNVLMKRGITLSRAFVDKSICHALGSQDYLLQAAGLDAQGIVNRVKTSLAENRRTSG